MDTPSKTLVIGPAWVGDMVMAQSLCSYLKAQDPGIKISIVAPANTAPIAKRMPAVHDVIETTFAHGRLHLKARWRIGHSLKKQRFSQAFVLPGSLKAALVPFLPRSRYARAIPESRDGGSSMIVIPNHDINGI